MDGRISQALHDGRHKGCQAVKRDVAGKLIDPKGIPLRIVECFDDFGPGECFIDTPVLVLLVSLGHEAFLFLAEEPGAGRCLGEEEEEQWDEDDGQEAFDDEQPTMWPVSERSCRGRQEVTNRHPANPSGPEICVSPYARTPPNALEKALKAKMTADRLPRSDFLYTIAM